MLYLSVFLLFLFAAIKFDSSNNSSPKASNKVYLFELLILILLAGLRKGVGGDTFSYMSYWNSGFYSSIYDLNLFGLALFDRFGPGWLILSNLVHTFSEEFYVFQIVHACIINTAIFYFVNKATNYRFTVILLYFLTIFFYYNMEIMRQSLGNVLLLISLFYFVKKEWKSYFLFVAVAALFHVSALLFAFLPFVNSYILKLPKLRTIVIVSVMAGIMKVIFPSLSFGESWADGVVKYSAMQNASLLGNIHAVLLTIAYFYLARYCRKCDTLSPEVKVGVNVFFYFNLIGLFMPIFVTRYSTIMSIVLYIAMATLVIEKHKTIVKAVVWAEFVVFTLFRAYTIDVSSGVGRAPGSYYFYNRFYPYYSIFEDNVEAKEYYQFRYNIMNKNEG